MGSKMPSNDAPRAHHRGWKHTLHCQGMSISNGVISSTPSVYALNQTYTIYANQTGYSTAYTSCAGVEILIHTVVEDQPIEAIGFLQSCWYCMMCLPSLPNSLVQGHVVGTVGGRNFKSFPRVTTYL